MKNSNRNNNIAKQKSNLNKGSELNFLETHFDFQELNGSGDIKNNERSEEMTLKEVLRLKEALKKDGYTEEQIDNLLYYIANEKEYPGKD